jgi:hypothetical protein
MIWRLTYCNKKGVEARVDIIKGDTTSVEIVEGSANPFTLSYKLDKNDKSGHIMTSSADIEIFETATFNIDDLKTSNETELKVEYFEDNVLTWSGFILPDFFSREIGSPNIVRMTASDRLTALKGITLSDLPAKVSLRSLIELSLAQTGLSLALVAQIQINQGSTNILDSEILSQRLTDTRGRSISCYDILMSIMVATNSTIRQRAGQWVVYNKLEHELRTPTIFFDKVEKGAIRTIQPVASSVGVYQEFGGNRLHPNNYDFSNGLTNWTSRNGFEADIDNRVVSYFLGGTPIYQPDVTTKDYLVNVNDWITDETNLDTAPFLESNNIPIASTQNNTVEIEVDISAVMAEKLSSTTAISFLRYAVIATNGIDTYALTQNGLFEAYDPEKINEHSIILAGGQQSPLLLASPAYTNSSKRKGVLEVDNVNDFHINIRIYGSGLFQYVNVNFASVRFGNKTETPKGNLYKTTQGSNYTKLHDVETVIFGDYIRKGLNGYFYNYPIDDTSNLYLPSGELSSPTWITLFDATERPLLHHISRQKSRLFSVAHDILRANINVESFDPLAVFQDCKGGKYVVVSARFDFLRSEVDVELEQIAYDNTILKRDFIYSYFGEGEDSIKSIGGIAGGGGTGGTGGGGMTPEQLEMLTNLADWWKLDEDNDAIYSEKSIYSLKGVSALGYGDGGSSGGGVDMLDSWANYTTEKADYYVPASLLVPFRNDTLSRLTSLENDSGSGSVTSVGLTVPTGLSVSGSPITGAGTFEISFAPGYSIPTTAKQAQWDAMQEQQHTHANKALLDQITQSNIDVLAKLSIVDGNIKVDTTLWATGGISALGLGDGGSSGGGTSYDRLDTWANYDSSKAGWVLSALLGKDLDTRVNALNSALTAHTGNSTIHITSTERTNWNDANSKKHTHSNKALLDLITQSNIDVLSKLSLDAQGNVKVDSTLWATGGISALGLGDGGSSGGGGVDMLQSWESYTPDKANFYAPASLLVPFRSDTLSRLTSLESGSATSIATTGSGNAITSVSKSGNTLTFAKGSTFSLSGHTHTIAQITGLQGALDLKATQSDIDTAINNIEIGGRNLIHNSYPNNVGLWRPNSGAAEFSISEGKIKIKGTGTGWKHYELNTDAGATFLNNLKEGYYTISGEVKIGNDNYDGNAYISFRIGTDSSNQTQATILNESLTTEWQKISATKFMSQEVLDSASFRRILLIANGLGTLYFRKIKLERGTKDTDWTPAPEDQVSDWSVTDVNSFAFIKNKPTQLSQFVDNIGVATHIANTSNPHNVTKSQVGLGNVDNTSDANKPISTATQNALNLKANLASPTFTGIVTAPTFVGALTGNADSATNLSRSVVAGNGLTGGGVLDANRTLTLGTPSTLTNATTNAVTGTSHTHAITTTTVGASNTIVATDASGGVRGNIIRIGANWTLELSGTELVFKYNGVIKQRMLSDGTILAIGGVTALATS